jgi:hypothetical protein
VCQTCRRGDIPRLGKWNKCGPTAVIDWCGRNYVRLKRAALNRDANTFEQALANDKGYVHWVLIEPRTDQLHEFAVFCKARMDTPSAGGTHRVSHSDSPPHSASAWLYKNPMKSACIVCKRLLKRTTTAVHSWSYVRTRHYQGTAWGSTDSRDCTRGARVLQSYGVFSVGSLR